jgi:hypothetical protein
VDFRTLRDHVNDVLEWSDSVSWNPTAVPTGALLLPMVGSEDRRCRDGVLLWWRALSESTVAEQPDLARGR